MPPDRILARRCRVEQRAGWTVCLSCGLIHGLPHGLTKEVRDAVIRQWHGAAARISGKQLNG